MNGREFLRVARHLLGRSGEEYRRTNVGRAYYALFLECRDAVHRWGLLLPRHNLHQTLRNKFARSHDATLINLSHRLDRLGQWRGQADYQLTETSPYADDSRTRQAIQSAEDGIALLD